MTVVRGSILLVDDEEKILKRLGRALKEDGHDVVLAANAREGMRGTGGAPFRPGGRGQPDAGHVGARHGPRGDGVVDGSRAAAAGADDGARLHPDRARRLQAGRRGLPREAVRGGRAAGAGAPLGAQPPASHGKAVPDQRTRRGLQPLRDRGPEPRDAGGAAARGPGGPDQEHGAHHRRDRHRQGNGGAADPSPERAARDAAHQGQLRGDPRHAARIRALRPHARRLHRRHGHQAREIRPRRRRLDLPGRDRHAQPGGAVEDSSRAAGA